MNRRRGLLSTTLIGVTAIAVVLTGCSSSKKSTGGATGASGSAAAPTKSVITVGVPIDLTGQTADSIKGGGPVADAWGKWINATGGINGHPVKVIVEDAGPDSTHALAAVKDLVENQHVDVLVPMDSAETAWLPYVTTTNVPTIGGDFGAAPWYAGNNNLFALGYSAAGLNTVHTAVAKAAGAKQYGILVCAEVPVCAQYDGLTRTAANQVGLNYVGFLQISSSSTSYAAQCLSMKQKGWDSVQLVLSTGTATRVIQDCTQQGFTPSYFAGEGSFNTTLPTLDIPGLIGSGMGFPMYNTSAPVKAFTDIWNKYGNGSPVLNVYATTIWQALEVLHKSLANVGDTISPSVITNGLYTIKNETLGGLLPQAITYTASSHSSSLTCWFPYEIKNKQWVDQSAALKPQCLPAGTS